MTNGPSQLTSPNGKPLLLLAATLLFILLAMVTSWLVFLPQRIATGLQDNLLQRSGLALDVAGSVRLGFDQGLVVNLEEVALSQPGRQGVPLLTVERMTVPLSIADLFSGGNTKRELFLQDPVVVVGAEQGGKLMGEFGAGSSSAISDGVNRPVKIHIRNGAIKMRFGRGGLGFQASDIDGEITWDAAQGLAATLNGLLNGASTKFDMTLDDGWRALVEGSPAEISLASPGNQLSFSGRLRTTDSLLLDGRLLGRGESLRDFCNWLACNIKGFAASGPLEFESALSLAGDVVALRDLKLDLGRTKGGGNFTLSHSKTRPFIDGQLDFDMLDLEAYGKVASGDTAEAFSLNKDWSEKPLDFSDLGAFDGKLVMTSKSLRFAGLQTGAAKLSVILENHKLAGQLAAEAIADGRLDTDFSLDGKAAMPQLALKITTKAIEARTFLTALLGLRVLEGPLDLNADVKAEGIHLAGMISTLGGAVSMKLANGKLHGIDLGKRLAGSGKGWRMDGQSFESLTTLAADLEVDVKLSDGIAEFQEAEIKARGFALQATGEVDLLRRHVDLLAKPVIAAGQRDFTLPLAVKIAGPWEAPQFDSDIDGTVLKPALRLINKAADNVEIDESLGKLGKKAKKGIKKLFGN